MSDDDSYISDVSDSTSVEYCRNENSIKKEILSEALSKFTFMKLQLSLQPLLMICVFCVFR